MNHPRRSDLVGFAPSGTFSFYKTQERISRDYTLVVKLLPDNA